ncbi:MAG: hypothetical protein ACRD1V_05400 [Vicinamibacterales bacterium]
MLYLLQQRIECREIGGNQLVEIRAAVGDLLRQLVVHGRWAMHGSRALV